MNAASTLSKCNSRTPRKTPSDFAEISNESSPTETPQKSIFYFFSNPYTHSEFVPSVLGRMT